MPTALLILAQSNKSADTMRVVLWVGLLIGALMVLGAVIMVIRTKILVKETGSNKSAGPLEDLRRMRDTGAISEAEFSAAKAKVAARLRGGGNPPETRTTAQKTGNKPGS
ncbi:MAG: SHOCT domain-containing protein [Phycisphaerales bacterium]